ncbi:hypothetical protein [Nocardia jejuensis]|uniref:hypothetical protein n=1 Tax=Nocardia jejuensis TaxID=328049 RepID=UPI000A52E9E5|nr:hypothetical protein [Nocardia jejuensis]
MKRTIAVAAALPMLSFAAVVGAGTAEAAPQDCTINRTLIDASATCYDTDAPAGREYTVVVECWGLAGVPNAWPLMAIGPYRGSWGGSFGPAGQGSSSCIGPSSVGTVTNAYVRVYRE